MRIELRNVSYCYNHGLADEAYALRDVNAQFKSGEITAILGREGSGKSTLLQLLNGLLQPTSGQVLADGELLTPKRAASLRTGVAMVFQYPEHQLFAPTVFDDIAFTARRRSLGESEVAHRVGEAASLVGLDSVGATGRSPLRRRPLELSGGERRRVAIAGALVIRPVLLLLDEPMSGLDPLARRELAAVLCRLRAESDMGIILVSHSLEESLPIADSLMVLDGGTAVFDGAPEDLIRQGENLTRWGLRMPVNLRLVEMLRDRGMELLPSLREGWQSSNVVAAVKKARELRGALRTGVTR